MAGFQIRRGFRSAAAGREAGFRAARAGREGASERPGAAVRGDWARLLRGRSERGLRVASPWEAHRQRLPRVLPLARVVGLEARDWLDTHPALRRGMGGVAHPLLMAMGGGRDPDDDGVMEAPLELPATEPVAGLGRGLDAALGRDGEPIVAAARALAELRAADLATPLSDRAMRMARDYDALRELRGNFLQRAVADWAEQFVPYAVVLGTTALCSDFRDLLDFFGGRAAHFATEYIPLTATLRAVLTRAEFLPLADSADNAADYLLMELLPTHVPLDRVPERIQLVHAGLRAHYPDPEAVLTRFYNRAYHYYSDRIEAVLVLADALDLQHRMAQVSSYADIRSLATAIERMAHRSMLRRLGGPELSAGAAEFGRVLDYVERYQLTEAAEPLEALQTRTDIGWLPQRRIRRLQASLVRHALAQDDAARQPILWREFQRAHTRGARREAARLLDAFHAAQARSEVRAGAEMRDASGAVIARGSGPQVGAQSYAFVVARLQELIPAVIPGAVVQSRETEPPEYSSDDMGRMPSQLVYDPAPWRRFYRSVSVAIPSGTTPAQIVAAIQASHLFLYEDATIHRQWCSDTIDFHLGGSMDASGVEAIRAAAASTALRRVRVYPDATLYDAKTSDVGTLLDVTSNAYPGLAVGLTVPTAVDGTAHRQVLGIALLDHLTAVAQARMVPHSGAILDLRVDSQHSLAHVDAVAELLGPLMRSPRLRAVNTMPRALGWAGLGVAGMADVGAIGYEIAEALGYGPGAQLIGGFVAALGFIVGGVYGMQRLFLVEDPYYFLERLDIRINGAPMLHIERPWRGSRFHTTVTFDAEHPLARALEARWRGPRPSTPRALAAANEPPPTEDESQ